MKKKCLALILVSTLMLSIMNSLFIQRVLATPERIKLPFDTSWEEEEYQPGGRVNSVDLNLIKDFSSRELEPVPNQVQPPSPSIYGYDFGSHQLKASGRFGSSYSYCYFNLFDMTPESDARPPFKIRPHTFISIFYYHDLLADCMIDAQLYNKDTNQYSTLRDFNYDGKHVVDQNGVRIHPAHRWNDPGGSWQFVSFDLSIIYEQDPDWFVIKIWIGFDNGISGTTGRARTYFDLLAITYGVVDKETQIIDEPHLQDNACISASIEAWDYFYTREGKYDLKLKVAVSAFNDGYAILGGIYQCSLYPYILKVSTDEPNAMVLTYPEPTGVNLTEPDPELPAPKAAEFVYNVVSLIVAHAIPELALFITAVDLARAFYGLLKVPEEEPFYEWPEADWGDKDGFPYIPIWNWDPKNLISGEAYIYIPGIDPGQHSFSFTFTVDYYLKNPDPWDPWEVEPQCYESLPLTLDFEWSTTPDELPPTPLTPSAPSGPNYGYVDYYYLFTAQTIDPDDDYIRYQFDWDDDTTLTSIWVPSGDGISYNHKWDSPGTYYVKARAQDNRTYIWTDWSLGHAIDISYGGGGGGDPCPTLFVWNGSGYADYGVIDIHDPTGEDLIREVPIQVEDVGISNRNATFRLREGWPGLEFSESDIDQVGLFAVDDGGNRYLCPLISAEHNSSGNVLPQLLLSDDWKCEIWLLETIDLNFVVPHDTDETEGYLFVLEGNNMLKP